MRLENYINENHDLAIIIEMAMLVDDDMSLNEAFNVSDLKSMGKGLMKKLGMHGHKTGDGLIQVALKSGKVMAEFVYHALRGAAGNEDSKARVQELARKEITKEQFMDFLLKLDMATLHLVSGPLHAIDAWTGWHIWAHIKSGTETALMKAKKAISDLATAAKSANDTVKVQIKNYIHGIARLFGFHDEVSSVIKGV
jgi:hypothetical protein